jgi:hypothetical protein
LTPRDLTRGPEDGVGSGLKAKKFNAANCLVLKANSTVQSRIQMVKIQKVIGIGLRTQSTSGSFKEVIVTRRLFKEVDERVASWQLSRTHCTRRFWQSATA